MLFLQFQHKTPLLLSTAVLISLIFFCNELLETWCISIQQLLSVFLRNLRRFLKGDDLQLTKICLGGLQGMFTIDALFEFLMMAKLQLPPRHHDIFSSHVPNDRIHLRLHLCRFLIAEEPKRPQIITKPTTCFPKAHKVTVFSCFFPPLTAPETKNHKTPVTCYWVQSWLFFCLGWVMVYVLEFRERDIQSLVCSLLCKLEPLGLLVQSPFAPLLQSLKALWPSALLSLAY